MIVFDVTKEQSYADLSKWMEQVKQVCKHILASNIYIYTV